MILAIGDNFWCRSRDGDQAFIGSTSEYKPKIFYEALPNATAENV